MPRAVQLVLLSMVILTCLQTGAAHDSDGVASLSATVHEVLLPILKEIKNDLSSLKKTVSDIKKDLSSLNDSISDNLEAHDNQVTTELIKLHQNLEYSFGFIIPTYTCGGTRGWRRVVYLNFTDPNTTCPSGWQLTNLPKRTCGRVSIGIDTCDSVTFPVSGGDYTRVCGRIRGYQNGSTDAFNAYDRGVVTTIDGPYADGVSLTHGSPRQHIWTFAAGYSELRPTSVYACPCDTTAHITIPSFVGEDYFCESGWNSGPYTTFYPNDILWDGDGCTTSSTCCSFNNPPYFTKQLPSPTTDGIEVRLCHEDNHLAEDIPIEFMELYVQ